MKSTTETAPAFKSGNCIKEGELAAFEQSCFPVWVVDLNSHRVIWANAAAFELWDVTGIEELTTGDVRQQPPFAGGSQFAHYQKQFDSGVTFDDKWTIETGRSKKTVVGRYRGCLCHDGSVAMLCEAQEVTDEGLETLHETQALRYTGAMVSTYDQSGRCLYANPAASRSFGSAVGNLKDRILNSFVLSAVLKVTQDREEGRFASDVRTVLGERIHEIEARSSIDVLTGDRTVLLTEVDITDRVHTRRALDKLANEDVLTGLFNRNFLAAHADAYIATAYAENKTIYLIQLDLDRFKAINDTLGHAIGDLLLAEVAERLRDFFPKEAILGRLGGDEFCVLTRSNLKLEDMFHLAKQFSQRMKRPIHVEGHELRIDVSMGVCHAPPDPDQVYRFDALLVKADLAQYEAKKLGGDQVQLYRRPLKLRQERLSYVEAELSQALLGRGGAELQITYQPQVCLKKGHIFGAEALARVWARDGRELMPDEFVGVAETTGLIRELGTMVLDRVISAYGDLPKELKNYRLSVNVSPVQLQAAGFVTQLKRWANSSGVSPERIELELTETQPISDYDQFGEQIRQIAELGYSIAIDDFGTGYSNLARLNSLPIHRLKIDRSLVHKVENRNLTKGVINMGQSMGLQVLAEGVDQPKQRDWLISEGCFEHQGYLYARPMPFADFCALRKEDIEAITLPPREST